MGNKEEIGNNIKKWRQMRNFTQYRLAEAIGKSASTIAMYETGKREPDMDVIEAIADVLNIRIIDLIPSSSNNNWNPDDMAWADHEDENVRILARGVSRMSKKDREKLLDVARIMFAEDFREDGTRKDSNKKDSKDDTEL